MGDLDKEDQLKQKIVDSFMMSGHPFEAKIGRAFKDIRIDDEYRRYYVEDPARQPLSEVQCAFSYQDPDTTVSRELDLCVVLPFHIAGVDLWIHFHVQCKATNKVWAFGHHGFEMAPTIQNKFIAIGISFIDREEEIVQRAFLPDPILRVDPSVLCSVGRVLTKEGKKDSNKDEIYGATVTSAKSVSSLVSMMENSFLDSTKTKRLDIFIPMVVTSNCLYWLDLSKDDELKADERNEIWFIQKRWSKSGNIESYVVPIVKEESLSLFVNGVVSNSFNFIRKSFLGV